MSVEVAVGPIVEVAVSVSMEVAGVAFVEVAVGANVEVAGVVRVADGASRLQDDGREMSTAPGTSCKVLCSLMEPGQVRGTLSNKEYLPCISRVL